MIQPVSSAPVDLLRASSDQIRRAAALLAQLTEDTAANLGERMDSSEPGWEGAPDESELSRQTTILKAQRSFAAGLKLAQVREANPETSRPDRIV
jgi:hypothetical protein